MVRPLGSRSMPTWAAVEALPDGKTKIVVVEKVRRGDERSDAEIADWIRDVRRIATLEHPNLGRVRDVSIRGTEVLVTSDYIDGVRWSEAVRGTPRPSLETSLRVLVDVLAGLGALHNLRDGKREPLKVVHGDLSPHCVIVGLDGIARVVLPCRVRGDVGGGTEHAYLAPELLLGDESADARADLYGVGAMLWEALCGRPLFDGLSPSAILTHLLSGRVPRATVPENARWAEGLADLTSRALSADPGKRCLSAAAMAAEIRRIAGVRLPASVRVAGYVRSVYGERIGERREAIEHGEAYVASDDDLAVDVDVRVSAAFPEALPTATTRPPPPLESLPPEPMAKAAPLPQGLTAAAPLSAVDTPLVPLLPLLPPRPVLETQTAIGSFVPAIDEGLDAQEADATRVDGSGRKTAVDVPRGEIPPAAIAATPAAPAAIVLSRTEADTSSLTAMPAIVMPVLSREHGLLAPRSRTKFARIAIPVSVGACTAALMGGWLLARAPAPDTTTHTSAAATPPPPAVVSLPIPSEPRTSVPTPSEVSSSNAVAATSAVAPRPPPPAAAPVSAPPPPRRPTGPYRAQPRRKYEPEGI